MLRVKHDHLAPLIPTLLFGLGLIGLPARADDVTMTPPEPIRPIEMVLVKGGCYLVGESAGAQAQRPSHQVCVKDFYLGKYPVTQMQWTGTMGTNPSKASHCGLTCPVENVSWNDVQEFIKRLSRRTGKAYRLPTEAEWEYAARSGGKNEKWAGTSDEKQLGEYAWYYDNARFQTHPVGLKKPNGLGLYDMTGNVWEWMSDRYARASPEGAASPRTRSLRGGYWGDVAEFVRVANRIGLQPSARGAGYGFRLALPAR
jgi:formylglycine-generating enzyme required for sulfatase activity